MGTEGRESVAEEGLLPMRQRRQGAHLHYGWRYARVCVFQRQRRREEGGDDDGPEGVGEAVWVARCVGALQRAHEEGGPSEGEGAPISHRREEAEARGEGEVRKPYPPLSAPSAWRRKERSHTSTLPLRSAALP